MTLTEQSAQQTADAIGDQIDHAFACGRCNITRCFECATAGSLNSATADVGRNACRSFAEARRGGFSKSAGEFAGESRRSFARAAGHCAKQRIGGAGQHIDHRATQIGCQ